MDKKNNNAMVPRLRFPGFSGAWEQRKLGKISDVLDGDRGNNYPNGNDLDEKGHTLFLSAANVTKNGFVFVTNRYITEEKSNSMGNGKLFLDDIVLTSRGSIGNIAWYTKTIQQQVPFARVNSGMLTLRFKNIAIPCFVAQFLKSPLGKKQIDLISFGSAQPQLTKKDVLNYIVSYPSDIEEQQQIGNFLMQFDALIMLNQTKLNHLKDRKTALLQQLFPKNGESVPRLRFPGFTDAWEQRKLGELASVSMNRRVFKEQTNESGDVPFFKIGTFGSTPDAFISRELFEQYKGKYPYPKVGDILISASGSIGRTVEYTGKDEYFQDSNIVWLSHDGRIDNTFLKCFYDVVKWAGIEGSTIKRLYNDNILNTEIRLPSVDEQRQIGTYFKNLDNLITLHQRKLNHLKDRKKALLQQLFI